MGKPGRNQNSSQGSVLVSGRYWFVKQCWLVNITGLYRVQVSENYRFLPQRFNSEGGSRIIYWDTDSCIFIERPGQYMPINKDITIYEVFISVCCLRSWTTVFWDSNMGNIYHDIRIPSRPLIKNSWFTDFLKRVINRKRVCVPNFRSVEETKRHIKLRLERRMK